MFGVIYGLMAGDLETLPARRRQSPSIAFDPHAGGFVAVDGDPVNSSPWPGRGEVPGRAIAPSVSEAGLTVAEEMQRLAAERATKPIS